MSFSKMNWSLMLFFTVCCLVGCSPSTDVDGFVKATNDTNIKKMGNAYKLYSARFGYTGPKSKKEFTSFLRTNETIENNMKLMGIDRDNIDDYFISENDGQEFKFRWGVFVNPDKQRAKEPIVFEQEGKDGVRLVVLSNGKVLEVDDDKKYQKLLKGKVNEDDAKTDLKKDQEAELSEAESAG